jgi:UDP-GlcNAc:undecaprenyl-phosphate GlcNAc-1-phosphate transferase
MTELVLVLLTSFTLTFLIMPLFIKYLSKKEILDAPGRRKIHRGAKPSLGGIPMFMAFLVATLIWLPMNSWHLIKFILFAQTMMFLIGVRDDLLPIKAVYKLIGQILAVSLIIFSMGIRIRSFDGLWGINELPVEISIALTYLVIIGITNAFNLIDGLDGLAGTIAVIAFLTMGVWIYLNNSTPEPLYIISAMVGAIIGFLIFNWQPSLIFMGDTGSLVIGLTISITLIQFLNQNAGIPLEPSIKFNCPLSFVISSVIVPVTDTTRIIILRTLKGYSPLKPDKNHIHHAIMRLGMTHSKASIILGACQLAFVMLTISLRSLDDAIVLPVILVAVTICCVILDRAIISKAKR